jgi:hypothetical protein
VEEQDIKQSVKTPMVRHKLAAVAELDKPHRLILAAVAAVVVKAVADPE